jgi:anti-sigma regulatory factor (Ser/Thr protein kinase)
VHKHFKINNKMEEVGRVRVEVERIMREGRFSDDCRSDVHLVCEEILCNIISYGYPHNEDHSMEMQFVFDGQSLTLEFIDGGVAFDPLNRPDPNLDDPDADDRPVGGLGIFLVKELTDQQDYERQNGKNHLTIKRSITLSEE